MGINNPLPSSLASECKKCGKILTSFIDPKQAFGPDKVIPPEILSNAKGLAILTVLKAGFIGTVRAGSGLVVARLPNGGWSAPSAIVTVGGGVGGQIGFELTDFVFILNDSQAVKTFSQQGSITLGGNVSLAAGPVGRNAEAAGVASLKSVSGVFSYSKTKGLFAGVSLEGSAIAERRDANEKLYGQRLTAAQLLAGQIQPPPQAASLMSVLNSRVFMGANQGFYSGNDMYNDVPVYNETSDNFAAGYDQRPTRSNTWNDNLYDNESSYGGGQAGGGIQRSNTMASRRFDDDDYVYRDRPAAGHSTGGGFPAEKPGRPAAPKPNFTGSGQQSPLKQNEAVALFTFDADQPGDLGFKKGDVITVVKKTESSNDWWTGMIGNRHGIFPANYVKMNN